MGPGARRERKKGGKAVRRDALQSYLDHLLDPTHQKDYCPNGLQVEGKEEVCRVVCGVTASQHLLDAAVVRRADAVLVHHGYFWRGEDGRVTGIRRRRLATLLGHDLNLFAYHLPLDSHPELGNNAQFGRLMGWHGAAAFGDQELGWLATLAEAETAGRLARSVAARIGREPLLVGDPHRPVRRVGWCTGAAQGFLEQAIAAGADLYLSGEISEQTVHLAREAGVAYLAAGHHATERYGVMAVGHHLRERFGLAVEFVDQENPV
jgi:dinuclear metal center YbgI/SA1388 family protein